MIDSAQLLLIAVVTALTTLLVIVGIQVIYILRELRQTVNKLNKILDDAGVVSESVAKPIAGISGFLTGIKSGVNLIKLLEEKKEGGRGDDGN